MIVCCNRALFTRCLKWNRDYARSVATAGNRPIQCSFHRVGLLICPILCCLFLANFVRFFLLLFSFYVSRSICIHLLDLCMNLPTLVTSLLRKASAVFFCHSLLPQSILCHTFVFGLAYY